MLIFSIVYAVNLRLKIIDLPLSLVNLDQYISESFASLNADLEKLFGELVGVACNSHPDFASDCLRDAVKPKITDPFLVFEFFIVVKDLVPSVLTSFTICGLLLLLFFLSFHRLNVPSFCIFD